MNDFALYILLCILTIATAVNLFYLLPFPVQLKSTVYEKGSSRFRDLCMVSIAMFIFYTYSYMTMELEEDLAATPIQTLEIRARIWKVERNFHMGLFNLISWLTVIGIERLLCRFNILKDSAIESKKDK